MKKLFCTIMIFLMLFETTAFAEEKENIKKINFRANGEKIEFEIEGQKHEIGCRCIPDPEVKMLFEEGFDADEKKLYFRIKWKTETAEEVDIDNYYIPPRVFAVPLKDAMEEEFEMSLKLEFEQRKLNEDTTYSLWLIGGDDYKDNFLKGKKDVLLREDFVVYQMPEEKKPTEVLLTIGENTIQYKGEKKYILEPIILNENGCTMIAAKDVGMIMEGLQTVGFNILWNNCSDFTFIY